MSTISLSHKERGHWLFRTVHEQAFAVRLADNDVPFEKGVLELEADRAIDSAWEKQLLNYRHANDMESGIQFNFRPLARFKRYLDNEKMNPRKSALARGEEVI